MSFHPDATDPLCRETVQRFCTVSKKARISARGRRLLDSGQQFTVDTPFGPVVAWDWEPDSPEKPIVLLCHGWSDSAATWIAFIPPLRDAGFRPVAFDQPAHGATAELTGIEEAIFPRMNLATESVMDWAESRGKVAAIVGHSVGALGAFLTACDKAPEKLVCIAMPPAVPWFIDHFIQAVDMPPEIRHDFRLHLRYRFHQDLGSDAGPEDIDSIMRAPDISMPTLLIQDNADVEVPIETTHRTLEAMIQAGCTVESLDTENLGHQLVLRAPQVISRVMDFLQD